MARTIRTGGIPFESLFLVFFFVCLALVGAKRAAGEGCVFESPDGSPYMLPKQFPPQGVAPQGTPLTVVALGDSVVWGDGDKPEHKIVTLVSQNLANDTGRVVNLHIYAHSGARLESALGEPPTFPVRNGLPVGNVGSSRPTTTEQADCARVKDSNADYILLDGCINEIGATNIALPPTLGLNKTTPEEIRSQVMKYCAKPMRNLLEKILKHFNNQAKIIVLNYFLVVSEASEPKPLYDPRTGKQEKTGEWKRWHRQLKRALDKADSMAGTGGAGHSSDADIDLRVKGWSDNANEFLDDTTSCFRWAIASASANTKDPVHKETDPHKPVCQKFQQDPNPSPSPQRIFLAEVSRDPEFSYGTKETHLWLMPVPLVFGLSINPDEMYRTRNWECDRYLFVRKDSSCKVNPLAHPRPVGAQCYSESILQQLGMKWTPPAGEATVDCGHDAPESEPVPQVAAN
jgi:lysophospholipase L1-like esterase